LYFWFFFNFYAVFSWNCSSWGLVVYLHGSSISYGFNDKLDRKRTTKTEFQNLNFLILHPVVMHFFFANWLTLWVIDAILFRKRKRAQISNFAYLEGIFNTWNNNTWQMSKIQQFTILSKILWYTLVQISLVNMLWSYHASLCVALYLYNVEIDIWTGRILGGKQYRGIKKCRRKYSEKQV
jgi:hypothetical protein